MTHHPPAPNECIDAWVDGLKTRVATGHRVADVRAGWILLDEWDGIAWNYSHSIPATASWRVAEVDPSLIQG